MCRWVAWAPPLRAATQSNPHMTRITQALLVKRAEHNDGILRTLEEIALHAQGIERIELLNQCCRHLRILYLQNNIIPKIEQLHRLKVRAVAEMRRERAQARGAGASRLRPVLHAADSMLQELEQLNLALNNIRRVQNLQRCESLQRLDLTANFVDKAGLLSLSRCTGGSIGRRQQLMDGADLCLLSVALQAQGHTAAWRWRCHPPAWATCTDREPLPACLQSAGE